MPSRESGRFHSTDAISPQPLTIRKTYERPAPHAYSEADHGSLLRAETNRRKGKYRQGQHYDCQDGIGLIWPDRRGDANQVYVAASRIEDRGQGEHDRLPSKTCFAHR